MVINKSFFIIATILISFFVSPSNADLNADRMTYSYLNLLLEELVKGKNIIFTKYGDGEFHCMLGLSGHNCDGDRYHAWLQDALKNALVAISKKSNAFIGRWWSADAYEFCNEVARSHNVEIPWVWYHLIMNDDQFLKFDYMYKFVEFIVKTKRKKILVCNSMNSRLKHFFRADVLIEIPAKSWSYEYAKWKGLVELHIEKNCIVLISGGLCSKVLISDLTDKEDISCIDLGSSFDLLARKQHSRMGPTHTYQDEVNYYKKLLPIGWN